VLVKNTGTATIFGVPEARSNLRDARLAHVDTLIHAAYQTTAHCILGELQNVYSE
jgi:hypothetical protein